jgi:hypothetical protein
MHYRTLEQAAIKAFNVGTSWATFWAQHAQEVKAAEPYNVRRFHSLYMRLLSLVTSGNDNGTRSIGEDTEPWERDDQEQSQPDDTVTKARLLAILENCGSFPASEAT